MYKEKKIPVILLLRQIHFFKLLLKLNHEVSLLSSSQGSQILGSMISKFLLTLKKMYGLVTKEQLETNCMSKQ